MRIRYINLRNEHYSTENSTSTKPFVFGLFDSSVHPGLNKVSVDGKDREKSVTGVNG